MIFSFLGLFLLGLGAFSGLLLLIFSIIMKKNNYTNSYMGTLWGLFIICTIAGIIIIALL